MTNLKRLNDNGNSVIIRFCGRKKSEDEFGKEFNAIMSQIVKSETDMILWRILWEIVRNIYDHNGGWGYLRLYRNRDGSIEKFEVRNLKPPSEKETVIDNGPNSGSGLGRNSEVGMIFAYAKKINLELSLDTRRGYLFKGIFKK